MSDDGNESRAEYMPMNPFDPAVKAWRQREIRERQWRRIQRNAGGVRWGQMAHQLLATNDLEALGKLILETGGNPHREVEG